MEESKIAFVTPPMCELCPAGASNIGQIANQAAMELAKEKVSGFFCLAGVGAHIKGMVKSRKEADLIISIDGCPVQCAEKTLQHAEI